MLESLTYLFDKIRIIFGDSECPLARKCDKYNLGYDSESSTCVSTRGRTEDEKRAPCYILNKSKVRLQKVVERFGVCRKYLSFRIRKKD